MTMVTVTVLLTSLVQTCYPSNIQHLFPVATFWIISFLENICFDPFCDEWAMSTEEPGHFICGVLTVVHSTMTLKLPVEIIWGLCQLFNNFICSLCMFPKLKFLNLHHRIEEPYVHVMVLLLKRSPNLEALNT